MDPVGNPAETASFQVRHNEGPGRQSTVGQYTTVTVTADPPRDHIIWSICNLVYGNPCCLGLKAVSESIKSRDRKIAGDLEGARYYGSKARTINIISAVLTVIMVIVTIIYVVLETGK